MCHYINIFYKLYIMFESNKDFVLYNSIEIWIKIKIVFILYLDVEIDIQTYT